MSQRREKELVLALQQIATGHIPAEPKNYKDTLAVCREIARKALSADEFELATEYAKLRAAAEKVTWWDDSDNDGEARADMNKLRAALKGGKRFAFPDGRPAMAR